MLKDAIKRAKNEKTKNIKVCVELKNSVYTEIEQNANEYEVSVENICKNIIEINIENEQSSNNIKNEEREDVNIWIISSKYEDAVEDFTQECLKDNQIRVGWYHPSLTTMSQQNQNNILEKKDAGAKTALRYFLNTMKEGDLVIMKEGTSKIHAIVQISSKCHENTINGFFYRDIKKVLIIPNNKSQNVSNIYIKYFKKSLNMTTLYRKSISKINFLSFLIDSSIEINS
jgi:hypothetical protein